MLWIQTQRGLHALSAASSLPSFDAADFRPIWIISFFDDWLPVWLRNCYFGGAQSFEVPDGKEFQVLPSDRRDAHIHWCIQPNTRHDLPAAASLFQRLQQLDFSAPAWDFEAYPGALWNSERRQLVLPIPIWIDADRARSALKPMIESIHWSSKARIKSAALLPLHPAGATNMPDGQSYETRLVGWKEAFSACFQHPTLSQPSLIETCNLETLEQLLEAP